MFILLTGKPGVGKSTLLKKLIELQPKKFCGVIAHEILDSNRDRVGFKAVKIPSNEEAIFAHTKLIKSHLYISEFAVDLEVIDTFITNSLTYTPGQISIVDEIGRMQTLSQKFNAKIAQLIHSKAPFVGTIVYDPEPWSLDLKNHPQTLLIEVTKQNRKHLLKIIDKLCEHIEFLSRMSPKATSLFIQYFKRFINQQDYTKLEKLMLNTLDYLQLNKVHVINKNQFLVDGKTNQHTVIIQDKKYSCDCPLFLGNHPFSQSDKGLCSHIMAVDIYQANQ